MDEPLPTPRVDITNYLDAEEINTFEDAFINHDMAFLWQLMEKHNDNQEAKELIFGSFYSLAENPGPEFLDFFVECGINLDKSLPEYYMRGEGNNTIMEMAMEYRNFDLVEQLVNYGVTVNGDWVEGHLYNKPLLFQIAIYGHGFYNASDLWQTIQVIDFFKEHNFPALVYRENIEDLIEHVYLEKPSGDWENAKKILEFLDTNVKVVDDPRWSMKTFIQSLENNY